MENLIIKQFKIMNVKTLYQERIEENKAHIRQLEAENEGLEEKQKHLESLDVIENWLGYTFQSSSGLTQEFADFFKDVRKHLKKELSDKYELVSLNRGHFYFSGFVKNWKTGKYAYFSTSDVRFFKDEWYNNVLVRTAKGDKDFSGGSNNFTTLKKIVKDFDRLTA